MRQLLRDTLESYADITIVGEAASGEEAVSQASALQPSVVLMDINLPMMNEIRATQFIKLQSPSIAVIGLTDGDQGQTQAIIAAGAAALINKGDVLDLYRAILKAVRPSTAEVMCRGSG